MLTNFYMLGTKIIICGLSRYNNYLRTNNYIPEQWEILAAVT